MDENDDINAKFKEFEAHFKDFEKFILAQGLVFELKIAGLVEAVDVLQRKMQRLNEVYYHIFPDRYRKDFEFEQQLLALKGSPDPDAGQD